MTRMPCQIEGCCKIAVRGVYCREHTGDFCSVEECDKQARRYGLCTAHGGGYRKPCYTEGCGNLAQKGGFCDMHQEGCGKWPRPGKGGMCIQHFKESQDAASGN